MENIETEIEEQDFWPEYTKDTLPPLPELSEENKIILNSLLENSNQTLPFYGIIYCITSPENKKYIGQSVNWEKRYNDYRNHKCPKQKHLQNALNLYSFKNMKIEILNFANNQDELNKLESYYEIKLDTLSKNGKGYNIRRCGGSKGKHSEETKRLMSIAHSGENGVHYGKKLSPEHILKLKEAQKGEKHWTYGMKPEDHPNFGKTLSDETKDKISQANSGENHPNYGKHLPEEHRKNIGLALTGRILSPEHCRQISERQLGEKNHMWGRTLTNGHKQKIAEAFKDRRPARFDYNYYKFYNPTLMITFEGTSYDFYTKYSLKNKNVGAMLNGKQKTVNGWHCLNPKVTN